jgi:transcription termination/antitermination protein NusG
LVFCFALKELKTGPKMKPILTSRDFSREVLGSAIPAAAPQGPFWFPRLAGEKESWFALYVQVNHEREVATRLQQKDVGSFLPLMECWSKRKDRRKKVSVPVFPGYVFVRTILDNYTHVHILKTPGALTIIGNSEGPLPIPLFQIENLQTVLKSKSPLAVNSYLKEGNWVRVIRGPLAGCMGILLRQNPNKGRLIVNVDMICRSVSVELDVEDVEATIPPVLEVQVNDNYGEKRHTLTRLP